VERVVVLALVFVGAFVLVGIGIVCFAAYKIKPESFEFSTAVWKLLTLTIKITSAPRRTTGSNDKAEP
jgi:hypothetical protein